MNRYRDITTNTPDYEPLPFYSSDHDADGDLDLAAWLADSSPGSVPEAAAEVSVAGFGEVPSAEPVFEAVIDAPATDLDALPDTAAEAGSVPERETGSVPERETGSVPERETGSVPERETGTGT